MSHTAGRACPTGMRMVATAFAMFVCSCFAPTDDASDAGVECGAPSFLCVDSCGRYEPSCTAAGQFVCAIRSACAPAGGGTAGGSARTAPGPGGGSSSAGGSPGWGGGAAGAGFGGPGSGWFGGCGGSAGPGAGGPSGGPDAGEGGGTAAPVGGGAGQAGGTAGGGPTWAEGVDGTRCHLPYPGFHIDCIDRCRGGLTSGFCERGAWVCPVGCPGDVDAGFASDGGP